MKKLILESVRPLEVVAIFWNDNGTLGSVHVDPENLHVMIATDTILTRSSLTLEEMFDCLAGTGNQQQHHIVVDDDDTAQQLWDEIKGTGPGARAGEPAALQ